MKKLSLEALETRETPYAGSGPVDPLALPPPPTTPPPPAQPPVPGPGTEIPVPKW